MLSHVDTASPASPPSRVLVLGLGYSGRAVLALASATGLAVAAVVRREETAAELRARGIDVTVSPEFGPEIAALTDAGTHVVVTFPPDGATDTRVARALPRVSDGLAALTYLSATSVYGDLHGSVDDATPVASSPSPAARRRLEAEDAWRSRGSAVLRCPAIYGPDRGLHVRIRSGAHRIPGDGLGYVSRVHVEDLAAFVLAAPRAPGETFVIGDTDPAPHRDVVAFVCETYGVPMPPCVPLEHVHETLRGDRRIDPSRALARLGVTLRYPTYRVGMREG
jgi:nucleoside-diphosphate-sugar epimerase